jgi:GNAT superfamily N-acetyltransferase
MWFRLPRAEWSKGKGGKNRRAFRRVVTRGPAPGMLAYEGRRAVGWCAFAPREEYGALARARSLKPVDDRPVWSVTCFFVAPDWRRRGLNAALLEAACGYAKRRGATLMEGYPITSRRNYPAAWAYVGLESAFAAAGFKVVARPSRSRAIMRRAL